MSRFSTSRWLKRRQKSEDSHRDREEPQVRKPKVKKPFHSVRK